MKARRAPRERRFACHCDVGVAADGQAAGPEHGHHIGRRQQPRLPRPPALPPKLRLRSPSSPRCLARAILAGVWWAGESRSEPIGIAVLLRPRDVPTNKCAADSFPVSDWWDGWAGRPRAVGCGVRGEGCEVSKTRFSCVAGSGLPERRGHPREGPERS